MTPTEAELLLLSSPLRAILDHLPEHVPPEVAVYAQSIAHYPLFEQKAAVWLPKIWAAEGGQPQRRMRCYNLVTAACAAHATMREWRFAGEILQPPEVRHSEYPFDRAITRLAHEGFILTSEYFASRRVFKYASRVQNNTDPSKIKLQMAELLSQLPQHHTATAHMHFLLNHYNLFLFPEQQVPP